MSERKRAEISSSEAPPALGTRDTPRRAPGEPEVHRLSATAAFPNSRYPALVYRAALLPDRDLAQAFEQLFAKNGWVGSWRNGLYRVHHYHSTAHEVLGVYRGHVSVRLGGAEGPLLELGAGDVAVVPAGVAHKNEQQSPDFAVVGAYPRGTSADLQYGESGERPTTDHNVAKVPLPERDPVAGAEGALLRLWR
jgi:uncharacterized protein YjlB